MRGTKLAIVATAVFAMSGNFGLADELSTMTSQINSAATAMGNPNDMVGSALSSAYPGVDVTPYVGCVVDNTTSDDLTSLGSSVLGNDGGSAAAAMEIVNRPETTTCISDAGLSALTN
ncbi:hypothetical protein [Pseudoruegeria sp. SK021]|uniref:hypothetical protein n=1 Tax=Pseudoruegeria sp. SK021 TaxID=1933035 RepID=UPI000A233790|nr:hypothetical protein [Pseudoruegeria sp. SK021]OSP56095.1 hypothetical protein BV911_03930 [Pseudoruegeria sp. SK021]